jgi:hypothetical protein
MRDKDQVRKEHKRKIKQKYAQKDKELRDYREFYREK